MYFFSEDQKKFFNIDRYTGDLYKTASLVNDSFGYKLDLEVILNRLSKEKVLLLSSLLNTDNCLDKCTHLQTLSRPSASSLKSSRI